jgi:outer membrane protein assembly factor BamB
VARSSPSVAASGAIAIGARDNKLWDIAPNGAVAWTYRIFTDGDVLTSPAILPSGDIVIACNFGAALHTLHPDGSLAWTLRLGGGSRNISPAIAADGTIFMGTTNGSLYAVSSSGAVLWELRAGRTNNSSSPAIAADGTIYVGSKSGVSAVDPATHAVRWTFPVRRGVDATPAIAADGTIYFGSNAGTLYALRPDGQLEWSAPGRGGFLASAAIGADGVVYTASGRSVVAYSPGDATHAAGAVLWEYETGGLIESSLAIGPGSTLYAASRDDKLYAFGP